MSKRMLLLISVLVLFTRGAGAEASTAAANLKESRLEIGNPVALVEGVGQQLEIPPKVIGGTTMLPIRFAAEKILHASVDWDGNTQTITLLKGSSTIRLRLNSTVVQVNNRNLNLNTAPLVKNGRTLVPLRFLAENLNLEVNYIPAEQTVIIRQKANTKPSAQFTFVQPRITAGQEVEYIETSVDADGHQIIDYLWEINYDESLRNKDLNSLLHKPTQGTYNVRLKVKDQWDLWSDWSEQILVVEPNLSPEITDLKVNRKTAALGEAVEFSFTVENESWEKLNEERWLYQWHLGTETMTGVGKPRAFFYPGEYSITLAVRDAYGNWSEPQSTELTVSEEQMQSELTFKFSSPVPGEMIENPHQTNFNYYQPNESFRAERTGPTLLLSNSPEIIKEPGILYQDQVEGLFRVMYHHRNSLETVKQLMVIAENKGDRPAALIKTKAAFGGPVEDVLHLGQLVALKYLQSEEKETAWLQPGEKLILYQNTGQAWKPDQTFTGMLDFETSGPLTVSIAAVSGETVIEEIDQLPALPRDDRHIRGTFPQADRLIKVVAGEDAREKVVVGKDGEGFEAWLDGYDRLTGDEVINKGNYGAVYQIAFTAQTRTGILLNPRGTKFKGAFQGFDGILYQAPAVGTFYGLNKAAVVGVLEAGETANLTYTPPNGSDAPVIFGLIPEKFWETD